MANGEKRINDRLTWKANWPGVIEAGTSSIPLVMRTYANIPIKGYFTSASTDASNSVQPLYFKTTMTGTGGVGGRAQFHLYTNKALGGWANALKGYTEFGAAGRITGLASAVCAEIKMSAGCTQATYAALEAEVVMAADGVTGGSTSFLYCNVTDTAGAVFNTNGYLFELGSGIVDTANGLFDLVNADDIDATAALRIRIGGTNYFIPISTTSAFNA